MFLKKPVLFLCVCLLLFTICGCDSANPNPDGDGTREVTDLAGRKVMIPAEPSRIAAIPGPTYEMVFMLGGQDRIALTRIGHTTNYPIALLTNPDLANYPGIAANPSSSVNIEEYLSRDIDLVLYWNNDQELKKFEAVDIAVAVITGAANEAISSLDDVKSQTLEEFIDEFTTPVFTLAEILGEEAMQKAEVWREYNIETINMLYERTRDLRDDQRKTVYWGNTWGENILSSHGITNRYYETWLCGGELVAPKAGTGNFPETTREQLFEWDPDVILVDNHGNYPELVIESMYREGSVWSSLSAVKNQELHRIPAGVFFLDRGTTTALMMQWMAVKIQPELFSDIDLLEEVKYYFQEFYEFDLTDDQAQKILDGWYERVGEES